MASKKDGNFWWDTGILTVFHRNTHSFPQEDVEFSTGFPQLSVDLI
jgi:hypothetical protein